MNDPAVPRRLALRRSDLGPLVEAMAARSAAARGWINLAPDVGEDGRRGGEGGWFSGRGPAVPHATWVPGRTGRRGRTQPAQVGIEHGAGRGAVTRLTEAGHPVPPGWRLRQDHPRRGLVLDVAADTTPAEVAGWLLDAAALLSQVPIGDAWLAEVWGEDG